MKLIASLIKTLIFLTVMAPLSAYAQSIKDDGLLSKLADWDLGFTTNVAQRDADLAAKVEPRWGLSELRFQQIWHDRDDGYWLYYEASQPDVRPDRNHILRLYRNAQGDLKVDLYFFNDTKKGLALWGKGEQEKLFDELDMSDIATRAGCNAVYHWLSEFERFVGVNPHGECYTIGKSYLLQHIEISKNDDGVLVRKDWHSFYDENGMAKQGSKFKIGDQGPTVHIYTEKYELIDVSQ